jgi:hypothetical protein
VASIWVGVVVFPPIAPPPPRPGGAVAFLGALERSLERSLSKREQHSVPARMPAVMTCKDGAGRGRHMCCSGK